MIKSLRNPTTIFWIHFAFNSQKTPISTEYYFKPYYSAMKELKTDFHRWKRKKEEQLGVET